MPKRSKVDLVLLFKKANLSLEGLVCRRPAEVALQLFLTTGAAASRTCSPG